MSERDGKRVTQVADPEDPKAPAALVPTGNWQRVKHTLGMVTGGVCVAAGVLDEFSTVLPPVGKKVAVAVGAVCLLLTRLSKVTGAKVPKP